MTSAAPLRHPTSSASTPQSVAFGRPLHPPRPGINSTPYSSCCSRGKVIRDGILEYIQTFAKASSGTNGDHGIVTACGPPSFHLSGTVFHRTGALTLAQPAKLRPFLPRSYPWTQASVLIPVSTSRGPRRSKPPLICSPHLMPCSTPTIVEFDEPSPHFLRTVHDVFQMTRPSLSSLPTGTESSTLPPSFVFKMQLLLSASMPVDREKKCNKAQGTLGTRFRVFDQLLTVLTTLHDLGLTIAIVRLEPRAIGSIATQAEGRLHVTERSASQQALGCNASGLGRSEVFLFFFFYFLASLNGPAPARTRVPASALHALESAVHCLFQVLPSRIIPAGPGGDYFVFRWNSASSRLYRPQVRDRRADI
ncbi:BZ3500_MvSof-1268-A1-R1_Chr2-2g04991 [Microbotryum saponariae]|uniref:BZ3500_MvSof-1268-A1-R1_Chr2-2g04991 protein n=1 Tax=Microbotryum saponariae TaxID=289078 RepID=A0A2X0M955_9BASI|nr:BZ3500_MvSof-1268-A1-R1_Chr2-2g04991 [Microbotryum saponariae]SDA00655.1 BZ3501_MvSof-1269-A2-R1_Chr2-2g04665 [Microbotryum saponariae]